MVPSGVRARARQGHPHLGVDEQYGAWGPGAGSAAHLSDLCRLRRARARRWRSSCARQGLAIALGVAWVLPAEGIITAIWSEGNRWLPGQLLSALAHGGTSSTSYSRALLLVMLYAAVIAAGTLLLFRRRDA